MYYIYLQEQPDCHGTGAPPPTNNCSIVIHSSQPANMASLEADLKKQILGRPKAEKVFRPWWDTLEDYLLNSLVLLGKRKLKYELEYVDCLCFNQGKLWHKEIFTIE